MARHKRRLLGVVALALVATVAVVLAVTLTGGKTFAPTQVQRASFVESQAKANCLVQRTVFPTRKALDDAFNRVVNGAGLDHATLHHLQDYEDAHIAVRIAISKRVAALCGQTS
ncbi:MAG: hypothetical protein QOI27_3116 [Gaiellaceae bacterium]|nr:hypothetical protein [Gaiellaceae bacterium]